MMMNAMVLCLGVVPVDSTHHALLLKNLQTTHQEAMTLGPGSGANELLRLIKCRPYICRV